jgi:hypothetical protein
LQTTRADLSQLSLEVFEEAEGFDGAHVVDLQAAEFFFDLVAARFEEADLERDVGRLG